MHGNLLPEAIVNLPLQHFKSDIVNYRISGNFVLKIFRVLNFRVKKFSWSWLDHEIFQHL